MKVGILLSDRQPNTGGGYIFQIDILEALATVNQLNSHTFVILGDSKSYYFKSSSKSSDKSSDKSLDKSPNAIEVIPYRLDRLQRLGNQLLRWSPHFDQIWQRTNRLQRLIKTHNLDILWFLSPNLIPANIPYIVTIWDLQHRLQPWFPEVSDNGLWDAREREHTKMLRSASMIITGTEVGKREVENFYQVPFDNIKVVPFATPNFALNISNLNDEVTPFSDLDGFISKGFLFYPAQFWAHKNHIGLLLAVQSLRDRHQIDFPVVFVGSDKGNQKYIQQIVEDLKLQVHFLGFVTQDQLIWLYRHAFALVFPTFFGPDNLPPLEAFALGCPVIASKVDGAEEQLGNAALLFDPKQPQELAIAIKSLWQNPQLRQNLIDLGLFRAKQWTSINYVNRICKILDEFSVIRQCWSNSDRP
jgi:glycosyltransferase involved in cell wall biosynthesis